ncbi:MAG: EAL domain-containing protein [Actinomycetota bacterium]|nr:EAL domain-containing protein [Actinomycetota bacterium]
MSTVAPPGREGRQGEGEQWYAGIVEGAGAAIASLSLDGRVLSWNRAAAALYGYGADAVVGRPAAILGGAFAARLATALERLAATGVPQPLGGARRRGDGSWFFASGELAPVFGARHEVVGASLIEREGPAEHDPLGGEVAGSDDLVHVGSWKTTIGPDNAVTLSDEAARLLGLDAGQSLRNVDFFQRVVAEDRDLFLKSLMRARLEGIPAEIEVRVLREDGSLRWFLITADRVLDELGEVSGLWGVLRDITSRKLAESKAPADLLHDPLTGLPNRTLLIDRLERALLRAASSDGQVGVCFVDLDRFERFNDHRGHERGDELLCAVALRLREHTASTDSVARFNDDEFVVVLEDVRRGASVLDRAERLLDALRQPFHLSDGDAFVTASVGVALAQAGAEPDVVVHDAVLAMYRSKEAGRNRAELYTATLREEAEQHARLEAGLRKALGADELSLVFQPVVRLADRAVVGVEALVRWRHPRWGSIDPEQFIPIAEEGGLIAELGDVVLTRAVEQLAAWRAALGEAEDFFVAFNVSAAQLNSPGFVDTVAKALERAGVPASMVHLELTESLLVDSEAAAAVLAGVRQLGVRLAIDDFGTKYSSLAYLKNLPVDELKIDRSFVRGLGSDEFSEAIVAAVLAIGHSLRLPVTAEGVETAAQAEALAALGCQHAQGFYFSPALAAEDCLAMLAGGPHEGATSH